MPEWTSLVELEKSYAVAVILIWLSVGAAFYDHVRHIPFDVSIIRGERSRRWPQFLYFGAKIIWWVYIAASIVLCYTTHELNCNALMQAVEFLMGAITVCCSALLACRTTCVWQGKERTAVNIFLGIFTVGLAAVWMAGVHDVTVVWSSTAGPAWTQGLCVITAVPPRYSAKYLVTIAFDLTVMVLTIVGIMRMQSEGTRLGQLLLSQGIVYFFATFVVNVIVCAFCLARLNPILSLAGAVPSSLVSMISATQLYIELAKEARPRNVSTDEERPIRKAMFSGSTAADKFGSFFSGASRSHEARLAAFLNGQDLEQGSNDLPLGVHELRYDKKQQECSASGSTSKATGRLDASANPLSFLGKELGGVSVEESIVVESSRRQSVPLTTFDYTEADIIAQRYPSLTSRSRRDSQEDTTSRK